MMWYIFLFAVLCIQSSDLYFSDEEFESVNGFATFESYGTDDMFNKLQTDDKDKYSKLTEAVKLLKERKKELETVLNKLKDKCTEVTSAMQYASASILQYVDTSSLLSKEEYPDNDVATKISSLDADIFYLIKGIDEISATITGLEPSAVQKTFAECSKRILALKAMETTDNVTKAEENLGVTEEAGSTSKACPKGWSQYLSHCYGYIGLEERWPSCLSLCSAFDAYLVELNTKEEWAFVAEDLLPKKGPAEDLGGVSIYTGATDIIQEGTWMWPRSGDRVSIGDVQTDVLAWAKGQPDNWYDSEHYGELRDEDWMGNIYHMNDLMYVDVFRFLCEKQ